MVSLEILERLFHAIEPGPITFNKLCRATKLHPKTVRNYLKIAEWIQAQGKIIMERQNFKVVIRKSP